LSPPNARDMNSSIVSAASTTCLLQCMQTLHQVATESWLSDRFLHSRLWAGGLGGKEAKEKKSTSSPQRETAGCLRASEPYTAQTGIRAPLPFASWRSRTNWTSIMWKRPLQKASLPNSGRSFPWERSRLLKGTTATSCMSVMQLPSTVSFYSFSLHLGMRYISKQFIPDRIGC